LPLFGSAEPFPRRSRRRGMARRTSIVIAAGLVVLAVSGCAQPNNGQPRSPTSTALETSVGVLRGHLHGVGGPAPGSHEAWAGTVTISGPGLHRDIAVAADGSYSVTLVPGRYTVVGRSPHFGEGRQLCRPVSDDAEVTAGATSTVDVLCQMK
jgi:hypothetical protein